MLKWNLRRKQKKSVNKEQHKAAGGGEKGGGMGEIILSFGRFSDLWTKLAAGRGAAEGGPVRFWGGATASGRTGAQTEGSVGLPRLPQKVQLQYAGQVGRRGKYPHL